MSMKLNAKQIEYREDHLRRFAESKRAKADSSLFCEHCGKPGDCHDPKSTFSANIPTIGECIEGQAGKPFSDQLVFDDIKCFWVCPSCTEKNKQPPARRHKG